jgi:hypothetical protein
MLTHPDKELLKITGMPFSGISDLSKYVTDD